MNKEYLEALESMKNRLIDAKFTIDGTTLYSKNRDLDEDYKLLKEALTTKTTVKIDFDTKVKIDRYFELWYKVDCDGDEILHDMKTPEEVEEMHNLRKELEEAGICL